MKSSVNVIYLDNHLLVLDKPAGVSTQPHDPEGESLETEAKLWIKATFNKPGKVFLTPIHRLDKPVQGLVLFARTSKALSRLQEEMRQRRIQKTYYARIGGHLEKKEGMLRHFLHHGHHLAEVVSESHGKEAILTYRVLKEDSKSTTLEIELHTGRYHQIRAQFSFIGHPICGDEKYGSKLPALSRGIDLIHGKLTFFHPVTHEKVSLISNFQIDS